MNGEGSKRGGHASSNWGRAPWPSWRSERALLLNGSHSTEFRRTIAEQRAKVGNSRKLLEQF